VQRWLARQNKGRPPAVAIICGLLMLLAGLDSITNHGPHAINPAPLAASLFFFAVGIFVLAIGVAGERERRSASDERKTPYLDPNLPLKANFEANLKGTRGAVLLAGCVALSLFFPAWVAAVVLFVVVLGYVAWWSVTASRRQ
jgi:hypothetical protein